MGFFSSSQTQSSSSTENYQNQNLSDYTSAYRTAAPWGFATLDPTATLASMGKGNGGFGAGFKTYLQGLSGDEKQQATDQQAALQRIQQRQTSGQFLTPQETDFINQSLDKAFEYANTTGMRDITLQAQALAGRQGLRTSDTPVAQPTMQATRDLALGIGSQRAQAGLGATMQMSQQQNSFDESMFQTLSGLQQSRQNTRIGALFGGGLSGASNIGYTKHDSGTSTVTGNPSGFQQFMGGLSMATGVLNLGSKIGSMGLASGNFVPGPGA